MLSQKNARSLIVHLPEAMAETPILAIQKADGIYIGHDNSEHRQPLFLSFADAATAGITTTPLIKDFRTLFVGNLTFNEAKEIAREAAVFLGYVAGDVEIETESIHNLVITTGAFLLKPLVTPEIDHCAFTDTARELMARVMMNYSHIARLATLSKAREFMKARKV